MAVTEIPFLELLRKSNLIDSAHLEDYLQRNPQAASASPSALATQLIAAGFLTKFQSKLLMQGKYKGFILCGKYKILDMIGVGGMGRVFLCKHMVLQRLVALKTLATSQLKDPSTVERFFREARVVAALDDPNIVRVYDLEREGELPLMVMEYVDGLSLHQWVSRHGPLSLVETAHYIAQAALGLQHASDLGIVHRDIKPANLLLDRQGVIKILDMGLARFTQAEQNNSVTERYDSENVLGTVDYLAPEQAVDSSAVDTRADIYSLGATMYFLLTGKPPFPFATTAEKLLAHQSREFPSLRLQRPELPTDIDAIVQKMSAKAPEDRYQHPGEIVEALAPWTEEPIPVPDYPSEDLGSTDASGDQTARRSQLSLRSGLSRRSTSVTTVRRLPLDQPKAAKSSRTWWLPVSMLALGLGLGVGLWLLFREGNAPADSPPMAKPKESPKPEPANGSSVQVGRELTLDFRVESIGYSTNGKLLFLNSKKNYRDDDAFTVVLEQSIAEQLYPETEFNQLGRRLNEKTISVNGKVSEYQGRPQIIVKQAGQIRIVE